MSPLHWLLLRIISPGKHCSPDFWCHNNSVALLMEPFQCRQLNSLTPLVNVARIQIISYGYGSIRRFGVGCALPYLVMFSLRSIELKRQLTNLSKLETKPMETFLREVKVIVDSLKALKTLISEFELIQNVVFALGPAYDNLITLTNMPCQLTFEELHTRLIFYDQRLKYMQDRDSNIPTHQAFVAGTSNDGNHGTDFKGASASSNSNTSNCSSNGGGRHWRGDRGRYRGRNNGFRPNTYNRGYPNSASRSMSTGSLPGTLSPEGILGPPPSHTICQTCHAPGHRADVCPSRCSHFHSPNGSTTSVPAYSSFGVGETNEHLWYPDTTAASHMTPHEGQHHRGGPSSGV